MCLGYHGRVYAHFNGFIFLFAYGKQFDSQSQFVTVSNILLRDARDALAVDVFYGHACMKRHRREDREFVHGIQTLHIVLRIGLRHAKLLRFSKNLLKACFVFIHFCKYVIRRAVDDAHHRSHFVCLKAVPDGAQYGNAAADTCLKIKPYAAVFAAALTPANAAL